MSGVEYSPVSIYVIYISLKWPIILETMTAVLEIDP
jgi:hypothetical protein